MKKTLLCFGLILVMVFSFAACGGSEDNATKDQSYVEQIEDDAKQDSTDDPAVDDREDNSTQDSTDDPAVDDREDNSTQDSTDDPVVDDREDNSTQDSTDDPVVDDREDNSTQDPIDDWLPDSFAYVPCGMHYWEISDSVDADTQLQERVFSMAELQNSIEYDRNPTPFKGLDEDFFKEKSLLIYRFTIPYSGGQAYVTYAYTYDGKSITVQVAYVCGVDPNAGNALVLIELNRNEYTEIDVHVSIEAFEFTDDDVIFTLTKEATDSTIFHDYTIGDFPEINAVSIEEIDGRTDASSGLTYRVRQCLLEDPSGSTIPDHLKNYQRTFVIKLTEKSKENVLRAVNILMLRDDIEYAGPNYLISID